MGLYGGLSLTLYSLCIAHANDYLSPAQMVGTASALIMVNGAGSVIGSLLLLLLWMLSGIWGIMVRSQRHILRLVYLFCYV